MPRTDKFGEGLKPLMQQSPYGPCTSQPQHKLSAGRAVVVVCCGCKFSALAFPGLSITHANTQANTMNTQSHVSGMHMGSFVHAHIYLYMAARTDDNREAHYCGRRIQL